MSVTLKDQQVFADYCHNPAEYVDDDLFDFAVDRRLNYVSVPENSDISLDEVFT